MGETFWLMGRSGSGKTALSRQVEKYMDQREYHIHRLDGDEVRDVVNNFMFTREQRELHLLYMAFLCKILNAHGINVVCAFITPFETIRQKIRNVVPNLHVISLECSESEVVRRDVKNLYAKNLQFLLDFEDVKKAELIVNTERESIEESAHKIMDYLETLGY